MVGENKRLRVPKVVVTRAMADAGKLRLDMLTALDDVGAPVMDDVLVIGVFEAMWTVYWDQVHVLKGKALKAPNSLILPGPFRSN
jgi:hypothetical protein